MSLKEYRRKRKFGQTPEPAPQAGPKKPTSRRQLTFAIQKHAASRTHYDFRLELDGVLKSWAVPKGPTLTSQDPRLAVHVEDHPLDYGSFEGVIPKGNYGAGTVMIWDAGTYLERSSKGRADSEKALRAGFEKGHLTFVLKGTKLKGEFALVKIKNRKAEPNAWLLIKKFDEEASRENILKRDRSSATGRSLEEIASQATKKGEVWIPKRDRSDRKTPHAAIAPPPRRVRPMEPVFAAAAPAGPGWLFENYGDGTRLLAEIEKTGVRLLSRALLPLDKKYPALVAALKKTGITGVLDGELVRVGDTLQFQVSDLLILNGKDLREKPFSQRRTALARIKLSGPLQLKNMVPSLSLISLGKRKVIAARRTDSRYRSGLSQDWVRFRAHARVAKNSAPTDKPPLTHLEKIFWPREGYTKGDLVDYYESIAPIILPYLVDRPQSLHRQPNGVKDSGFFHKDLTGYLPRRIETHRVYSESSAKTINYVLCQDRWALLYLVNLGCIELNPWLSRRQLLENPDYVVIDLDPDGNDFKDVVKAALVVKKILDTIGAQSFCKTSGASGLHICIPTQAGYDFETGRLFAEAVCRVVQSQLPQLTSVERTPAKRRGKIYLDFLQNRRGQTLAAPYCVRPVEAATVSTPLKWSEVNPKLNVKAFTIKTIHARLKKVGDLWKPMLSTKVNLEDSMKRLSKRFHT